MTPDPIKITRVSIVRAALAEIPARIRAWWRLQAERAREPFDFDQDWDTDHPAVAPRPPQLTRLCMANIESLFEPGKLHWCNRAQHPDDRHDCDCGMRWGTDCLG
ncbi:hypothetical protein ACGFIV_00835 [Sphaerisporangium sp. NPDC049003]|uniref:hypothetical protein n=1 Tax=Sphaerisporangium sp. NPDC049003 TaxID=3364517 RepID=UPI0037168D69